MMLGTIFKGLMVGSVCWLSTGVGFALVFGAWSLVKTGHLIEDGFILPGGALGGVVTGCIAGFMLGPVSSLVFAAMAWLRPWAFLRLAAIAPLWGLVFGGLVLLCIGSFLPPKGHPGRRVATWSLHLVAALPAFLWWLPWLWRNDP